MESDELYDSLDEDFGKKNERDLSKTVPLYNGEKSVEAVKSRKFSSKIPIKSNSKNHKRGVRKDQAQYNGKTSVNLLEFREKNSYLNIFHAKNTKFKKDKVVNDSARAEIGDFTERSEISESSEVFSDAKSSCSDTTSFYFDMIKQMEFNQKITTRSKRSSLNSPTDFNLKSISEFSVISNINSSKSKVCSNLTVPKLGRLGPDLVQSQEKLRRLQKQKSYGQKASDHNRIKILEIKVLKDLKQEIKNSKS